jgi:hypothetical protein
MNAQQSAASAFHRHFTGRLDERPGASVMTQKARNPHAVATIPPQRLGCRRSARHAVLIEPHRASDALSALIWRAFILYPG